MRAWGRLLQLLGCWSVLGATQLLRSSGSRAPPSPGTSAERGRSPVHACVQVCATVGLGWQPGGHSSELWVLQRLEQDYDLARGRLGLCCECFGCQPLLCWGKSHLHIAAKSLYCWGEESDPLLISPAKMAHAAASIKKVREAELDEKEKNLERERKKQRKIPRDRMERKRKVWKTSGRPRPLPAS